MCQSNASHIPVMCQGHAMSAKRQPHISHMSVTYQLHVSHMPDTCQSLTSHLPVLCKSNASHIPVMCQLHINVNFLCPIPFIHHDWSHYIQSKSNDPEYWSLSRRRKTQLRFYHLFIFLSFTFTVYWLLLAPFLLHQHGHPKTIFYRTNKSKTCNLPLLIHDRNHHLLSFTMRGICFLLGFL